MKLGQIYLFETDKVRGYTLRPKYHVYICEAGWPIDGFAFLYINKGDYGGDLKILRKDYPFFPLDYSFIGVGEVVPYSAEQLVHLPPPVGAISADHLKLLHDAILDAETMERRHIPIICKALRG